MRVERRVYIASGLGNVEAVRSLQELVRAAGWTISYDWTQHGSVQAEGIERIRQVAHAEMRGVFEADLVLVALPGGRGTHVEMGLALAFGIPIVVYDPHGHELQNGITCAFYHLPEVVIARNPHELMVSMKCRISAASEATDAAVV